ncbi:MAG TPA: RagB/SusD family nutrient uptake outer membrane protein [Ohtaekwangia sp.]|uniref:RagB/SusD family nutrient uptake outer membrane protein n=1 Tax=Ohtaekwangia sp. TaxID=2066019 RepID=UPI002F9239D7
MIRYITRFILLYLIAILCYSCSDSFLDITNQNELNSDNFYEKIESFDLALNGTYDAVKNLDLFGQTFYVQTLLALPHESDYWNAQNRNEVTSADANVYIAWRGWYRIVARANDILENAPKYEAKTPAEADQLSKIVAQAHFLRGFAYFHLVRLWGEDSYANDSTRLAVPLILKVASTKSEMMKPRASVGQVYTQIIKDFEAAEAVLPVTWDANNIARVSKYAVKGFLGQVYLYMGDNDKAKLYFEEVIGNGSYALVPFSRYEDLFQGKDEFSEESLWELNYTIDMQQNIWENGLGSGIALVLAPPGRGWSNCTPHGVNIDRFGNDPRLKIATYAPEDLVADVDGNMTPAGKSEFNYTGHSFKKYVPKDYSVYSTNRNSGINYLIMRLADVYLMYAEVMNNKGSDAIALEYTNKVRRRAYGYDPNTPVDAVDFKNIAGTQLRDAIREERFRELFAEGHRWYDIVRWGIVEEEVLKYNVKNVTQGTIVYQPKDYYYPIPLQEVDNNTSIIPSTGY